MCYLKSIYQTFKYSSHEKSELFDEFHALGQKQAIILMDIRQMFLPILVIFSLGGVCW